MTKIMIVEREESLQQKLAGSLMRNGYTTITTDVHIETIKKLSVCRPDIVLVNADTNFDPYTIFNREVPVVVYGSFRALGKYATAHRGNFIFEPDFNFLLNPERYIDGFIRGAAS